MDKSEKLFAAIKEDRFEEAFKWLSCGANPNRLLLNGVTPFHFAIGAHSTSAYRYVKLILQFNGNANVQDAHGLTPFHVAADWGKADCLNLLLKSGADISLTDKEGKDVFVFAEGDENCMLILEEYVLSVNRTLVDEQTCNKENVHNTSARNTPTIKYSNYHKVKATPEKLNSLDNFSATCEELANEEIRISHNNGNGSSVLNQIEQKHSQTIDVLNNEQNRNLINMETSVSNYKDFINPLGGLLKAGLDATSPDNCFLFIKPDCNKSHMNKHLNETVKIDKPPDVSSTNVINFENSTHESTNDPNQIESDPLLLDTPKSICHQSITDEMAKQMLMDTKRKINFDANSYNNCLNQNLVEHLDKNYSADEIESIDTTADTTVLLSSETNGSLIKSISHQDQRESDVNSVSMLGSCSSNGDSVTLSKSEEYLESTRFDNDMGSNLTFEMSSIKESSTLSECFSPPGERISWNNGPSIPLKLSISCISNSTSDDTILYDWKSLGNDVSDLEVVGEQYSVDSDESVHISEDISEMTDEKLRNELIKHGVNPGPINHARNLYKKKLQLLENGCKWKHTQHETKFSHELRSLLLGNPLPQSVVQDDESLRKQFDDPTVQSLRGGLVKDSFNYLLLDPRISDNLPSRVEKLSEQECLKAFVGAIFYVGKGKNSRPYAHLKEAIKEKNSTNCSTKIQHIHDIWNSKCGVISLHVFQNVMACEAYTREAAMIEALGLNHLTNKTRGKSYGECASWNGPRLRRYGTFLILSAMQILLVEGERQIRSNNIKANVKN